MPAKVRARNYLLDTESSCGLRAEVVPVIQRPLTLRGCRGGKLHVARRSVLQEPLFNFVHYR